MVAIRLARQAFRDFRATCFWSFRDIEINADNVDWVTGQLRRNGNSAARIRALLCP
ncbi:MAG TPA: hypothetical protein VGG34_08805 [Opitutaceae bacterium]|jgi:hypothetical protein